MCDHVYAAIRNYLEEEEKVEASCGGDTAFYGKTCNIPPGGELVFAWMPNSCLDST